MPVTNPIEVTAVGFSLSAELNPKRNLVMQSHVASDASSQEIYGLLDKLCNVADTLDTRYRLIDLRLLLEKAKLQLPVLEKKLREFEEQTIREYNRSGRKSEFEWKGQAHANRDNLLTSVAACRMEISGREQQIAEAEAELEAMNGPSSTTNRFPRAANS